MTRGVTKEMLVPGTEVEDVPRSHGRLVDAIKGRDPQVAESEMRAHIRRGMEAQCVAYRLGLKRA